MRSTIWVRYCGQQKFAKSVVAAVPDVPPPDGRVNPPNGTDGPPVSARASPVRASGPVVGFRDDDLSTARSVRLGGFFSGVAFGSGATISGTFGAGGTTGAGFVSVAT